MHVYQESRNNVYTEVALSGRSSGQKEVNFLVTMHFTKIISFFPYRVDINFLVLR